MRSFLLLKYATSKSHKLADCKIQHNDLSPQFRHRGEPGDVEGRLRDVTSTRQMLEAPFSAPCGPRSPPLLYTRKEEVTLALRLIFDVHKLHFWQSYGNLQY